MRGKRGARLVRDNLNDGAVDFGLRPKTTGANFRDHLYRRIKLRHDAEQTHFAGVWRGGKSLRHFALNGDMHAHAVRKVIEQNSDERRGRLIRQVGDQAKGAAVDCGRNEWVERMLGGQAIAFNERDLILKSFAVEGGQVAVHFAGDHVRIGGNKQIRESAGARTDFQNHFARANVGGLHERAKHVVIMQEVLPKAMLGAQAARGKNGFDFCECLHLCMSGKGAWRLCEIDW